MVKDALVAFAASDAKPKHYTKADITGERAVFHQELIDNYEQNPNLIIPYQYGDIESDFAISVRKCRKPTVKSTEKKAEKLTKSNLKRLNATPAAVEKKP